MGHMMARPLGEHKEQPDPWRKVALVLTRRNAGSKGGSWYVLTLECGHEVMRPMRTIHGSQLLCSANVPKSGAPKKVRCMWCGAGHDPVPVPTYQPGVNAD